jgi:hypothetical protein
MDDQWVEKMVLTMVDLSVDLRVERKAAKMD